MPISQDARYIALGPEVGSRIQSRELVLLYYMVLSGTLLSAALTNPNRVEFALAIPYLAFASALVGIHHDLTLGVLADYMKELTKDSEGPRWHHDPAFFPRALRFRTIRDIGAGFFKIFSVGVALFVTQPDISGHKATPLISVLWWGGVLCGLGVLVLMIVTWGVRNERRFARWFWSA
jgi:hypothetical protein